MKKLFIFVIVALLTAMLAVGCSPAAKEEAEVSIDLEALQKKIQDADLFTDIFERITKESVLSSIMFLDAESIETYLLYMGSGYTGEEYGLFKCVSAEAAEVLVEDLKTRVESQKNIYADYAPEAIPRLNNAIIRKQGSYVAFVVADKNADALKIVEEYFK